ncbi:hypothetical protein D5S17_32940 [Pseudonocardiaceae bacterium YIM PH 21723]|nr:hypothetical protein D5S17_32940 [Pseudonocardiaceae bacterium YIM PH 21723]
MIEHPYQDVIEGLRMLAHVLEMDHDIRPAYLLPPHRAPIFYTYSAAELDAISMACRAAGFSVDKEITEDSYNLVISNGRCSFKAYGARESVCERVQTGTRTVLVADPTAPKVEVQEPVYEWKCVPLAVASGRVAEAVA